MDSTKGGLFYLDKYKISVYGTNEDPWFLSNEIEEVFGIKNIHQNLTTVPGSWKSVLWIVMELKKQP